MILATRPQSRNKRKRKRKSASFSSSSSSIDSSESEGAQANPRPVAHSLPPAQPEESSSDETSSLSSGSSSKKFIHPNIQINSSAAERSLDKSRTPSPTGLEIPSFIQNRSQITLTEAEEQEMRLKERFRNFWMSTLTDEFKQDLEEIRKEPGLTQSRLGILINSLTVGMELYSSRAEAERMEDIDNVNEMELVMKTVDIRGSSFEGKANGEG